MGHYIGHKGAGIGKRSVASSIGKSFIKRARKKRKKNSRHKNKFSEALGAS